MKEELRLAVEAWRDRGVSRRRPGPRRFEQRLALLAIGAKHVVADGDANAVGGRAKIIPGVEQPISALLPRAEGALDQMAFPVEIVAQHDPRFADKRASVIGDA